MTSIVLGCLRAISIALLLTLGLITAVCAQTTAVPKEADDRPDETKPATIWLDADAPSTDHPEFFGEFLTRELVRQAVLIAARDGLGLFTRDAVLRDAMPEAQADVAHGDAASAKQLAQQFVDELNAHSPPDMQDRVGIFYLLAGERKKAYDAFRADHNKSHSYWSGLHVVLLADEFGDDATRDSVLNFLVQSGVPDRSASMYGLAKLAVFLHDAYASEDGDLDLSAVDDALAASIENVRMDASYFAARYLALRGRAEDAKRYLEECYASTDVTQLNRTLAGADLVDAGGDAEQLKGPGDAPEAEKR